MRNIIVTMAVLAGTVGLAVGGVALGGQEATSAADKIRADDVRLSASEINAYLREDARSVPDNCVVHYNQFTGECSAVVCTTSTGWQTVHECSEFGL